MNEEQMENFRMQEALQQQSLEAQQNAVAPQLMEQVQQAQAVLVEQTNPDKIVHNIMLRFQGLKQNLDGTTSIFSQPKMNNQGIENLWFILDSHINQNVILSHLEIDEIRSIMEALSEDVVDNLALNWKRYGIKKRTDLDDINNSILVNIFLALKRAQQGNEKNWLGKISVENISGGRGVLQPKKESFWSKFKV